MSDLGNKIFIGASPSFFFFEMIVFLATTHSLVHGPDTVGGHRKTKERKERKRRWKERKERRKGKEKKKKRKGRGGRKRKEQVLGK